LTNGKTETKQFTDYAPEIITKIVEHVTPQLLELIQAQKSYLTEKITFLRTATKQLSTLSQLKENLPAVDKTTEE
jgi:type VI protein secretion system component Hcp